MSDHAILYSLFLIFTGAALFATLALFARQAMIVGYIFIGIALGPWGFALVDDTALIADLSHIGIIFLLYLLGLDLLPRQLMQMLREAIKVALASALILAAIGYTTGYILGYSATESILIAVVVIFSSTIIGLKLLPTSTLHHRHTGQIIISILLLQDILAIFVLLILQGYGKSGDLATDIILQILALPALLLIAWVLQRYLLIKLISKYEQIHEYIFLIAVAWCLAISEIAVLLGLSDEIGAFIAGVSLASSPIALFIVEKLKPLRDFFLIIFFFSLGAQFNIMQLHEVFAHALFIALLIIFIKPLIFKTLLQREGEKRHISKEVGFRLGQLSEFSLLIAILALESNFINRTTSDMLQLATVLTFIISSFIIVRSYPTPIAVKDKLRRD